MNGYYRLIGSMSRGSSINPLWDGLQAYYTADNTSNDALGNYNGTLVNGATYGAGIINQGFSLDGVNDYVDLGNNLDFDGTTPFTFNFWVNISSSKTHCIVGKQLTSSDFKGYNFRISPSERLEIYLVSDFNTTNSIGCSSAGIIPFNTLTMVTVTYDGSQDVSGVKFYINSVLSATNTITNSLTGSVSNTATCRMGANPNGNQFLNGIEDEGSVFNVVKTQSEITELYNSGAGKQY